MTYVIKRKNGRLTGRLYKTKAKAKSSIKGIIKNNSLQQRKQTGYIGLKLVKYKPNTREKKELKKAKEFIFLSGRPVMSIKK